MKLKKVLVLTFATLLLFVTNVSAVTQGFTSRSISFIPNYSVDSSTGIPVLAANASTRYTGSYASSVEWIEAKVSHGYRE